MPEQPYDPAAQHVERLFDLTSRGPFSGYRPEEITRETPELPLIPGGVTEDQRFPLYLQGYIIGNMYNDRFISGPPDGDGSVIDNIDNKLPGWTTVEDTAECGYIEWHDDTYGKGNLEFSFNDACVNGDQVYVEQLSYIPGGNINIMSLAGAFDADSSGMEDDVVPFLQFDFVRADGTVVAGESHVFTDGEADYAIRRLWLMTRSYSYAFLRLRLGYEVVDSTAITADDTYVGTMYWGWLDDPESYDVTLKFRRGDQTSGGHWSPTASATWAIEMVPVDTHIDTSKWYSSGPGLILAMSASTDAGITGGNIQIVPTVDGTQASHYVELGYDVYDTFGSDHLTDTANGRDLDGVYEFDFFRANEIGIEANTNSSWALSAGGCFTGTLHLRLVMDTANGATGGGFGPAGS